MHRSIRLALIAIAVAAACSTQDYGTNPKNSGSVSFKSNPCGAGGTVQLAESQAARIDCGNGGTTVTFAGNGASYLVVPQLATDQGTSNQLANYVLTAGTLTSASAAIRAAVLGSAAVVPATDVALTQPHARTAQVAAERFLRARGAQRRSSYGTRSYDVRRSAQVQAAVTAPPNVGDVRAFHVSSSFSTSTWKTVGARVAYSGANIVIYIDTLAPANGFTAAQLTAFGALFDQTLYPIDTLAFGAPSDIDNNGRVIMLMSPVVNADTPASTCATQGYVAGFFDTGDFDGPSDPNSNQGEVFYTVVPDPSGTTSCAHTVDDVGYDVPSTFLHELQHLINFSQHVVVHGGTDQASWLDEGLSIAAEELGSLYYEKKCPPPACRTSASQLFPDSSQGFVSGFLVDSYQYALLPDTASITLHSDDEDGFSWRGGSWLLVRWLGDQMGSGFFRKLESGPAGGIAAIEAATGQSFPTLFANFGLALYTDSLPGLARATAPAANRFTSRNVKALWARLYLTSGGSSAFPYPNPVQLFSIVQDTSHYVLAPGTMTFFRLDTPATAATVSIQFAAPGGTALGAALKPQIAVFRLPAGQ